MKGRKGLVWRTHTHTPPQKKSELPILALEMNAQSVFTQSIFQCRLLACIEYFYFQKEKKGLFAESVALNLDCSEFYASKDWTNCLYRRWIIVEDMMAMQLSASMIINDSRTQAMP